MRQIQLAQAGRPLNPQAIKRLTFALTDDAEAAERAEAWAILDGLNHDQT